MTMNKPNFEISLQTTPIFIVFLVLKLCHVIDWSWWWITAPLWIPLSIVLLGVVVIGSMVVISSIVGER